MKRIFNLLSALVVAGIVGVSPVKAQDSLIVVCDNSYLENDTVHIPVYARVNEQEGQGLTALTMMFYNDHPGLSIISIEWDGTSMGEAATAIETYIGTPALWNMTNVCGDGSCRGGTSAFTLFYTPSIPSGHHLLCWLVVETGSPGSYPLEPRDGLGTPPLTNGFAYYQIESYPELVGDTVIVVPRVDSLIVVCDSPYRRNAYVHVPVYARVNAQAGQGMTAIQLMFYNDNPGLSISSIEWNGTSIGEAATAIETFIGTPEAWAMANVCGDGSCRGGTGLFTFTTTPRIPSGHHLLCWLVVRTGAPGNYLIEPRDGIGDPVLTNEFAYELVVTDPALVGGTVLVADALGRNIDSAVDLTPHFDWGAISSYAGLAPPGNGGIWSPPHSSTFYFPSDSLAPFTSYPKAWLTPGLHPATNYGPASVRISSCPVSNTIVTVPDRNANPCSLFVEIPPAHLIDQATDLNVIQISSGETKTISINDTVETMVFLASCDGDYLDPDQPLEVQLNYADGTADTVVFDDIHPAGRPDIIDQNFPPSCIFVYGNEVFVCDPPYFDLPSPGFDQYNSEAWHWYALYPNNKKHLNSMTFVGIQSGGHSEVYIPALSYSYSRPIPPQITSITDVGNDQGRQAMVTWSRCWYDQVGSPVTIAEYGIWRRIDKYKMSEPPPDGGLLRSGKAYPPGDWDFVKTVPARGELTYSTICPTLADSTGAQGIQWSVFFVSAVTSDPLVYFDSDPDSGYTVDNLAPGQPKGFDIYGGDQLADLSWRPNTEPDLDYYAIYRSTNSKVPLADTVFYTADTTYRDTTVENYATYSYWISAFDFSGNESEHSDSIALLIGAQFIRGDAEADDPPGPYPYDVDLFDGLMIIYWVGGLLPDPSCINACDADDDEDVDIYDGLRVIYYAGGSAEELPPPNLTTGCGPDPTPPGAGPCDSYPPCGWNPKAVAKTASVGAAEASQLALEQTVAQNRTAVVPVTLANVEPLVGFSLAIEYDPELVTATLVDNAGLVTENFDVFADGVGEPGLIKVAAVRDMDVADGVETLPAGQHQVARIVFEVKERALSQNVPLRVTNSVMAISHNRALNHRAVDGVIKPTVQLPQEFGLSQNYPNPFNPETEIRYALPVDCRVKLEIYNVLGQRVITLVDEHQTAGFKSVAWNASSFTSGVYLYRLQAGEHEQTRRMVLLR